MDLLARRGKPGKKSKQSKLSSERMLGEEYGPTTSRPFDWCCNM